MAHGVLARPVPDGRLPPRAERLAQPDPRRGPLLAESELTARLIEGARLFDAGEYFESHEVWEAAWHRAPLADRDFFRGLIHAAAACLHHGRGNEHGFARQMERMRRRLASFAAGHRGVDVAGLLAAMEALPAPGARVEYPRLGDLGAKGGRYVHGEEGEREGEEDRP